MDLRHLWTCARGDHGSRPKRVSRVGFLLTVDYALGHALERDMSALVRSAGGRIVGSVRHPLNSPDLSSFLLQVQSSGAKAVAMCNAGADVINAVKRAAEFGLAAGNAQRLVGTPFFISDAHSLGLSVAKGLRVSEPFYWDLDDNTRAFSRRFVRSARSSSTRRNSPSFPRTRFVPASA